MGGKEGRTNFREKRGTVIRTRTSPKLPQKKEINHLLEKEKKNTTQRKRAAGGGKNVPFRTVLRGKGQQGLGEGRGCSILLRDARKGSGLRSSLRKKKEKRRGKKEHKAPSRMEEAVGRLAEKKTQNLFHY